MDGTGWTVEELGRRIGKAPHRITERTALLTLRPEYQALLACGNLKPSEATELVRLSPRGQATLFNAIRTGGCRNYNDLRASSTALVNAEAQLLLMPDEPPPPTKRTASSPTPSRPAAMADSEIDTSDMAEVSELEQGGPRRTLSPREAPYVPAAGCGPVGVVQTRRRGLPDPDQRRAP